MSKKEGKPLYCASGSYVGETESSRAEASLCGRCAILPLDHNFLVFIITAPTGKKNAQKPKEEDDPKKVHYFHYKKALQLESFKREEAEMKKFVLSIVPKDKSEL